MSRQRASLLVAAVVLCAPLTARAATITIVNMDGAGEGLNDPTPAATVGGNTGTTLGAQRLIALQYAASIWAAQLVSAIEIRVQAKFDPLTCTTGGATLGLAGAEALYRDFAGAPQPATWYPVALASALAGLDLDPGGDDIDATFNSNVVGSGGCPFNFYLGLDATPPAPPPGQAVSDLVTVTLHEFGHGLGFGSPVDLAMGAKPLGFDDTYTRNLENHLTGVLYPVMTDPERVAASKANGNLHWTGAAVVGASGILSAGREPISGHVQMFAPTTQQPGSSVSHFDSALLPNQVMEPFYAGPNHDVSLALQVMQDLGWNAISLCGNGAIDFGEQCDDGATTAGDGCSSFCRLEGCVICTGAPSVCTPCAVDHYMCDKVGVNTGLGGVKFDKLALPQRSLQDQFGTDTCSFKVENFVCNPAEKNSEGPPTHPTIHHVSYKIVCPTPFIKITGVRVVDQFNPNGVTVDVLKRFNVLVPAGKSDVGLTPTLPLGAPPATPPALTVDHFLCYKVKGPVYTLSPIPVTVTDQFYPTLPGYPNLKLFKMTKLCTPVNKAGEDPTAPSHLEHLACYQAKLPKGTLFAKTNVQTNNSNFGPQVLAVKNTGELCVPARKNP